MNLYFSPHSPAHDHDNICMFFWVWLMLKEEVLFSEYFDWHGSFPLTLIFMMVYLHKRRLHATVSWASISDLWHEWTLISDSKLTFYLPDLLEWQFLSLCTLISSCKLFLSIFLSDFVFFHKTFKLLSWHTQLCLPLCFSQLSESVIPLPSWQLPLIFFSPLCLLQSRGGKNKS